MRLILQRVCNRMLPLLVLNAVVAQVNVLTWHNDAARTGQNLQENYPDPRERERDLVRQTLYYYRGR